MTTRKELIGAVGERYRRASRNERTSILDEFVALTEYHRKHAIRVLGQASEADCPPVPRARR